MTLWAAVTPGLSVVIPAWNEEIRLARTLADYVPALEAVGNPFEVIVVCDNSTDKTSDIAKEYSTRGVKILTSVSQLGKGGAILAGLRAARFSLTGFVDADGPIPAKDLLNLVRALDHVDCAIASRYVSGSVSTTPRSIGRRLLSRMWNLAARGLLLLPIRDTQCGAKFFRSSAITAVLPEIAVTNWAFDSSLLFHFHEKGLTIQETPVTWTESSGSKLVISRDVPLMLLSLVGVRLMNSRLSWRVYRQHNKPRPVGQEAQSRNLPHPERERASHNETGDPFETRSGD